MHKVPVTPSIIIYSLVLLFLLGCTPKVTPLEQLVQARLEYDQNNFDSAEIHLKNALQAKPDFAEARLLLGQLLMQQSNPVAAEIELQRARDLGAAPDSVIPVLARVLFEQAKWQELQQLPVNQLSVWQRGPLRASQALGLQAQGQEHQAGALLSAALVDAPNDPWVRLADARFNAFSGHPDAARIKLETLMKDAPQYAAAWLLLGDLDRGEQHYQQALKNYQTAIELGDQSLTTKLKLITIYLDMDDLHKAQTAIRQIPQSSQQLVLVHFLKGLLYFKQERFQDAINAFNTPIMFPRQYPQALLLSGHAHWRLKQVAQAEEAAWQLYQLDPSKPDATALLGTILLDQKRYAKLEPLLSPALSKHPDNINLLALLAQAQLGQGKFKDATVSLTHLLGKNPESASTQTQLGYSLLQQNDYARGVQHLQQALDIDPAYQQAYAYLVLHYLQQQQPQQAIDTALRYQQQLPEAAAPLNMLARVYLASGSPQAAEQRFAEALEKEPGNPFAARYFIEKALEDSDFERARTLTQQVLEVHPDDLGAQLQLARIERLKGNPDAMVARLQSIITNHPDAFAPRQELTRYYLSQQEPLKAQQTLGDWGQKQDSPPTAKQLLAQIQLQQKHYNSARSTLEQLIQQQPDVSDHYFMLAQVYAGTGNEAKMHQTLEHLLQQDPAHLKAHITLARLQLLKGQQQAFANTVAALEKIAPQQADTLLFRGILLEQQNQPEQALRVYQGLFEQHPSNLNLMRVARQLTAVGNTDEARALLQAWVKDNPDDLVSRQMLATVYLSQQQPQAAINEYRAILQQQPNDLIALNNLAWQLRSSQPSEALAYAETAYKLYPDNAEVLDTYAMTLLDHNQPKLAAQHIDRAVQQSPDNLAILYHQAIIEHRNGNQAIAASLLKELLGSPGQFTEREAAQQLLSRLEPDTATSHSATN
ncbi:PEP-CTERM system TPR-repeat protein PrsT [Aestuariicella hydrocarbonica]|uniref:PEP-CTERM system TPR-repeat protein PrsT n=1 Tax=Pseudomaricurvus hydrocarbonicus TaxID=1470433 RepID=A0A9E5JR08_9GAMM|nr:XrtA/PEP-CTERM system TPR-repeat protein PrsT [Aestuariicella hydrocarbonica]NHO64919.1 PEP-CTERM system TPR-repeat protein PrsT [Aestuariicella hydrocarbonica]